MTRNFPSWSFLHHKYLSIQKSVFPESAEIINIINKKLDLVINRLRNGDNYLEVIDDFNKSFEDKNNVEIVRNTEKFIERITVLPQQFITAFSLNNAHYYYVSKQVNDILGIAPDKFSLEFLLGSKNNKPLIIGTDLGHFQRFALCTYLVTTAYGFAYIPFNHIYETKFRIISPINGKEQVVNKRSFLAPFQDAKVNGLSHIDVWNVSNVTKGFRKVEYNISLPDNDALSSFQNQLIAICNARILGFSTKEIFLLNLWFQYGDIKVLAQRLHNHINGIDNSDNVKSTRDFIYKLKKKISSVFMSMNMTAELDYKSNEIIENTHSLILADQLGLLDFTEETLSIIGSIVEID